MENELWGDDWREKQCGEKHQDFAGHDYLIFVVGDAQACAIVVISLQCTI